MVLEEEVETVHVYTGQRGEPNYRAARPQCALELGGAGGTAYVQKTVRVNYLVTGVLLGI